MEDRLAVVVTSISTPNEPLRALADGCRAGGHDLVVVGDEASPPTFALDGCRYFGLDDQRRSGLRFARTGPTRHYSRKNVAYLEAIRAGATIIVETDDDQMPQPGFWAARTRRSAVPTTAPDQGWVNVHRWFSEEPLWPRGLPLDQVQVPVPLFDSLAVEEPDCPIQQGLTDGDPDVDAIHRLTLPSPKPFRTDRRVALSPGTWSPFNSENVTWWSDAFALLYLPSHCSFRMTDIWRSFVAQRIAWENGWCVLVHEPTVVQQRNPHDLMRDFRDELPGYLHNAAIRTALEALELEPGTGHLGDNLSRCYDTLIEMGLVGAEERSLLQAWLADLDDIGPRSTLGR